MEKTKVINNKPIAKENHVLIGELREDLAKLRQTTAMIRMDVKYIIELIKETDSKVKDDKILKAISKGWFG